MLKKNIFFISIVVVFLVIGFFVFLFFYNNEEKKFDFKIEINSEEESFDINKIQYIEIAGKILKVELALTSEAQQKGLSGRDELKEDDAMLFVFDQIDKYSFWMKDMNFPIDIIWIGEDLRVVSIKENATPESYLSVGKMGPESFTPSKGAKYVLEVISSFSRKNNLKEGDKIKFLSS